MSRHGTELVSYQFILGGEPVINSSMLGDFFQKSYFKKLSEYY
jgi:hypothetical protein